MRITQLLLSLALGSSLLAQERHGQVAQHIVDLRAERARFTVIEPFVALAPEPARDARWQAEVQHAQLLALDPGVLAQALVDRSDRIELRLPVGHDQLHLDLERVQPFADDFTVVTASNGQAAGPPAGLHYQGMVSGESGSLVAISIFEGEVMGVIGRADGNWDLGKLGDGADGVHILYRANDLVDQQLPTCGTADEGEGYSHSDLNIQEGERTAKCVRFYWEVNYDIFQGKGSVANATNYVTGLFNQSQALYNNDGISVTLQQVYVWDVPSPYTATGTSALLDQFGVTRTNFNGDLAHLLGYAGGGGIAWLNTLCSSNTSSRMAYSDINSTYQNVPTYSWSVEVVTHEQGHNMGSRHTHACSWNGNNTAIDGCGPNAGYTEGSCATAALPTGGGTIMSYCHLVGGVGINFANGFGPQPTAVIVNRINSASCLATCTGTTCGVPTGLGAGSLTATSASVWWTGVTGATTYTLQWKTTAGSTWTTVSGLTVAPYVLSGLTANTSYLFKVLAVCPSGSSAYSTATSFTTAAAPGCSDGFEPNETNATAVNIAANSTTSARIGSGTDVDWFRFANSSAARNIRLTLSNLPANYNLRLYRGSTLLVTSAQGGTNNEVVNYNTNTVSSDYKVRIYSPSGAFSTSNCYSLVVQTSATPFQTSGTSEDFQQEEEPIASPVDRVTVFPNPARDRIQVLVSASGSATSVELFDAMGRVLTSVQAQATTMEQHFVLDVADMNNGIYFVRAGSDGASEVHRVLIQH